MAKKRQNSVVFIGFLDCGHWLSPKIGGRSILTGNGLPGRFVGTVRLIAEGAEERVSGDVRMEQGTKHYSEWTPGSPAIFMVDETNIITMLRQFNHRNVRLEVVPMKGFVPRVAS